MTTSSVPTKKPSDGNVDVKILKCNNCGAPIDISQNKCEYCGASFVVEKTSNNESLKQILHLDGILTPNEMRKLLNLETL